MSATQAVEFREKLTYSSLLLELLSIANKARITGDLVTYKETLDQIIRNLLPPIKEVIKEDLEKLLKQYEDSLKKLDALAAKPPEELNMNVLQMTSWLQNKRAELLMRYGDRLIEIIYNALYKSGVFRTRFVEIREHPPEKYWGESLETEKG